MAKWGAKTVRLEHQAQINADAAAVADQWFEDSFFALQWLLARNPELGVERHDGDNGFRVYVQDSDRTAGSPTIWVLYSETENEIVFWDINVVKAEQNPD